MTDASRRSDMVGGRPKRPEAETGILGGPDPAPEPDVMAFPVDDEVDSTPN